MCLAQAPLAGNLFITSPFGARLGVNSGSHYGTDFRANPNTQVYAADDGVVIRANAVPGYYGNVIIIDHGFRDGMRVYTVYAHLNNNFQVQAGDIVTAGQEIGKSGASGSGSPDPHLHFEVIKSFVPLPWNQFGQTGVRGTVGRVDPLSELRCIYPNLPLLIIKGKIGQASGTRSPIVLDLNGDGVTTTGLQDGVHFDHDGNGFAEQTGWINSDDGLLVHDLNGNGTIDTGRELFGSETLLATGEKAANGYQALADLDSNGDGQITQQDTAFSSLLIWQDSNGDGESSADELHTLAEFGIESLATGYTLTNQTDPQGNTITHTSTFTRTNGSTGTSADVWFQVNPTLSLVTEWLDETAAVAALPDLQGYGNVYNLHQAMLRDSTGHLQDLVEQFAAAPDSAARHALLNPIIYAWTGVEGIDPGRGCWWGGECHATSAVPRDYRGELAMINR